MADLIQHIAEGAQPQNQEARPEGNAGEYLFSNKADLLSPAFGMCRKKAWIKCPLIMILLHFLFVLTRKLSLNNGGRSPLL